MKAEWRSLGKLSGKITLWVLAGCVTAASPAAAQGVVGKLTLPYQVRWGHTLLPPGEYNYFVEALGVHSIPVSPGPVLVTVRGARGGPATLLLAMASQVVEESGGNGLTFLLEQGERTLCSLSLNNLGIVVQFKMPRSTREMSAKKAPTVASAKAGY